MSVILVISICLRLLATGWSLALIRRTRDWRLGFLTVMLGLMALRQILTLLAGQLWQPFMIEGALTEVPGLAVSVMAFMAVFFLHGLLVKHPAEDAGGDLWSHRARPGARLAVAIGCASVLGCAALGYWSYVRSSEAIIGTIARSNLLKSRALVSHALQHTSQLEGAEQVEKSMLKEMVRDWERIAGPYPGSYLCVIGPDGVLTVHTQDASRVGTDMSGVRISAGHGIEPQTIGQLLAAKKILSGVNLNMAGKEQIVGSAYAPMLEGLVVVHTPMDLVLGDLRQAAAPWVLGLGCIGGLMIPLSLGLLHGSYRRSRWDLLAATDRLRDQAEALRQSERKYRTLVESSPYCIKLIDKERRLVSMNKAGLAMLGVTDESAVVGRLYLDVVCEADRERISGLLDGAFAGRPAEFEFLTTRGRVFQATCVPISGEGGVSDQVVGITLDVTDHHHAEQARLQLQDQLNQSQRIAMVGQLASGVAHDINNLLMVISGHTEFVKRQMTGSEAMMRSIRPIEEAVAQAAGVSRSLLSFNQRLHPEMHSVDLGDVVRRTAMMLRRLMPSEVRVSVQVPGRGDGEVWVWADEIQVQQVVLNLVINARDAMKSGGELRITVENCEGNAGVEPDKARARLCVSDTGQGMSAQVREHIFEPFFTTKGADHGTGLGLSVVRGIIEGHKGTIEIESQVGVGTTVTVQWPCSAGPAEEHDPVESEQAVAGTGELILVVEDHEQVRHIVAGELCDLGYRVLTAGDGDEFMMLYRTHREDARLLFLDVDLPKRGGQQCLRVLREAGVQMPAIIATGSQNVTIEPERDGDTVLLRKPFRVTQIGPLVRERLNGGER